MSPHQTFTAESLGRNIWLFPSRPTSSGDTTKTQGPRPKDNVTKVSLRHSDASGLFQDEDVGFSWVPRWIKFVALFIVAFMAFDVCSPERCEARVTPPLPNGPALVFSQQNSTDSDSDCCSFEEDCFNCGHFAPGHSFTLTTIAVVDFAEADLHVASLDRPPILPYHPPRA